MGKREWKGRYMHVKSNGELLPTAQLSERSVIAALKRLRREDGADCLFPLEAIQAYTSGSREELQSLLDGLARAGLVYGHGGTYRLN